MSHFSALVLRQKQLDKSNIAKQILYWTDIIFLSIYLDILNPIV